MGKRPIAFVPAPGGRTCRRQLLQATRRALRPALAAPQGAPASEASAAVINLKPSASPVVLPRTMHVSAASIRRVMWVRRASAVDAAKLVTTAADVGDMKNDIKKELQIDAPPDCISLTLMGKDAGNSMVLDSMDTISEVLEKASAVLGLDADKDKLRIEVNVALASPSVGKTFILWVNRENKCGDIEAVKLTVSARSQHDFEGIITGYGGGIGMVRVDEEEAMPPVVRTLDMIHSGGEYEIVGGSQEATRRHRTWTQVSDKVLEAEALKAVLADDTYGKLEEFVDYDAADERVLTSQDRKSTMELDGLAVNGRVAIVVEAKHSAKFHHIRLAKNKAAHVARIAAERPGSRLGSIKRVIPVLAANLFPRDLQEACELHNVGVVYPSGARLRFAHRP